MSQFQLQQRMQASFLGTKRWKQLMERRERVRSLKYYMDTHGKRSNHSCCARVLSAKPSSSVAGGEGPPITGFQRFMMRACCARHPYHHLRPDYDWNHLQDAKLAEHGVQNTVG